MKRTPKDKDETQLAKLTKSLLALPRKLREDSKMGKAKKFRRNFKGRKE
jgi:hypothetical protein